MTDETERLLRKLIEIQKNQTNYLAVIAQEFKQFIIEMRLIKSKMEENNGDLSGK